MLELIKSLFDTPEAESDPAAWATRFVAHFGLGVAITTILALLLPLSYALGLSMVGYTVWEAAQYRVAPPAARSKALRWDGVLDLAAWSCGAFVVGMLAQGAILNAVMFVGAGAAVLASGVWSRSR